MLLRLLLIAAKHVLEEVELGMGDGNQEKEGPHGLEPVLQHFRADSYGGNDCDA